MHGDPTTSIKPRHWDHRHSVLQRKILAKFKKVKHFKKFKKVKILKNLKKNKFKQNINLNFSQKREPEQNGRAFGISCIVIKCSTILADLQKKEDKITMVCGFCAPP